MRPGISSSRAGGQLLFAQTTSTFPSQLQVGSLSSALQKGADKADWAVKTRRQCLRCPPRSTLKSRVRMERLSSLESQSLKSQRQSSAADANGMGMTKGRVHATP